jgi:arabinose-5-phosphate isomerase
MHQITKHKDFNFIQSGKTAIETELKAIKKLISTVNDKFDQACKILLNCQGRIIVTGMGKSGHIGRKIAATLASTGSPSFFVHPAEASHGDLGMITKKDVVLAISNSGATQEILTILPLIKRLNIPFITLTGNLNSTLAKEANVNLDVTVKKEACPLNLAPTASTTAALVIGDALAVALLEARGFTKEDFAFSHPAGQLGRQLLSHVSDIMRTGNDIPQVSTQTPLGDALCEMSKKTLGMTAIVDKDGKMIGLFTDGDLRRALDHNINVHKAIIDDVMTRKYTTMTADHLAAEALSLMESHKINGFFVVDDNNKIIGAFNLHDLLHSGIV